MSHREPETGRDWVFILAAISAVLLGLFTLAAVVVLLLGK